MASSLNKISLSVIIILFFLFNVNAQEINCRIQINSSQIQGTNKTMYETMQKALVEFINNRNWTNNVYNTEERIECSFLLTIKKQVSVDDFEGDLQITSNRPVYNSGYSSPMLNIKDNKIHFRYAEGETLEFDPSTHNELTSLFAYYIYIILGFDYDSFSLMGGTPYFETAEKIVSSAQSSPYPGWKSYENRKNRYWLVENALNPTYAPIREYTYVYYRKGLDAMAKNVSDGRAEIASGLNKLLKVHREKPNSYLMQIFFSTKANELIKILSKSPQSEAMRAYNVLKEVDPANATKYQKIIKKN